MLWLCGIEIGVQGLGSRAFGLKILGTGSQTKVLLEVEESICG